MESGGDEVERAGADDAAAAGYAFVVDAGEGGETAEGGGEEVGSGGDDGEEGDARRKRVEGVVADAHRAPRRRAGLGADRRGEQATGLNQRGRIAGLEEGGGGEGGEGGVDAEALGASAAIGTVAHHVGEAPQGELAHAVGGVGMGQHRADRLGGRCVARKEACSRTAVRSHRDSPASSRARALTLGEEEGSESTSVRMSSTTPEGSRVDGAPSLSGRSDPGGARGLLKSSPLGGGSREPMPPEARGAFECPRSSGSFFVIGDGCRLWVCFHRCFFTVCEPILVVLSSMWMFHFEGKGCWSVGQDATTLSCRSGDAFRARSRRSAPGGATPST